MYCEIILERTAARDLIPLFIGHETCQKLHKFGPNIRDYYLIHFCLQGKGELFDKYGKHEISAGQLFIIRPDEITTYIADSENPWEYAWVAFQGTLASVFDSGRSVYNCPIEIGTELKALSLRQSTAPTVVLSLLYRLIYELFDEPNQETDVAETIKQYVRFNYMNDLSMACLSRYFGFERSYLYRVFYKKYGIGIKEFIIQTRLEQAKALLEKGYAVGETAFAVGYKDPFNFSKAYKRHFGVSPKAQKRP